MATPKSLRRDLECVWSADTSVDPDAWTPERPSTGHCAVTAMLVAEYTDATTILRVVMPDGQSHYYNALPDGSEVDLTRDQFDSFDPVGPPEERTFGYLLSNDATLRRYELLRNLLGSFWFDGPEAERRDADRGMNAAHMRTRWCYIVGCKNQATLVLPSHPDDITLCDEHRWVHDGGANNASGPAAGQGVPNDRLGGGR